MYVCIHGTWSHGDRNHVAVQIEELLTSAQPLFTAKCCIYRVPHEIRESNPAAYTPKVVSIGPLHHGDPKLLPMEGQKQLYCQKFIERSASHKVSFHDLVSRVQDLEPEVRRCYSSSDNIKLAKKELVKVILVDCGFLIELFLRSHHLGYYTHDDVVLFKPWMGDNIKLDLLLLENQVPFFILEELCNIAFDASILNGDYPSFRMLTSKYFSGIGGNFPSTGSMHMAKHFTDLLRTSIFPTPTSERLEREDKILDHLHSATELNEAGVKFKVNSKSQCILDLQFSGCCCFEIPKIEVEDSTEMLFRNVMALEHCHYPYDAYFIDYVVVLNFLINTEKDVDVLVKNGIIVNWLGDDNEVAELFNGLGKHIICTCFNKDYLDICKKLNAYYKHPLSRGMGTLKRDYCNTPWKMAASFAGILLLILTIIQTIFSVP